LNPVANNFWGKDDAGVTPLLDRMHNAKVTCDELKAFYTGTFLGQQGLIKDVSNMPQLVLRSKTNMLASS
jgi:hypothetical protein